MNITPESWTLAAPCNGKDEDFETVRGESPNALRVRRAKRVCLTECAFRRQCLEACFEQQSWSVLRESNHDEMELVAFHTDSSSDGIWGGTTPDERRAVAHLPLPERIEVLLLWSRAAATGRLAPALPSEIREEASA